MWWLQMVLTRPGAQSSPTQKSPSGNNNIQIFSESAGRNSCCISFLGKKMPYKTLFYFWLQWKAGRPPLSITGAWRVQAFNKDKCPSFAQGLLPLAPAPAHSAPFHPSKSFYLLFFSINPAKTHLLPDHTSLPAAPEPPDRETNCKASLPAAERARCCRGQHGDPAGF